MRPNAVMSFASVRMASDRCRICDSHVLVSGFLLSPFNSWAGGRCPSSKPSNESGTRGISMVAHRFCAGFAQLVAKSSHAKPVVPELVADGKRRRTGRADHSTPPTCADVDDIDVRNALTCSYCSFHHRFRDDRGLRTVCGEPTLFTSCIQLSEWSVRQGTTRR